MRFVDRVGEGLLSFGNRKVELLVYKGSEKISDFARYVCRTIEAGIQFEISGEKGTCQG